MKLVRVRLLGEDGRAVVVGECLANRLRVVHKIEHEGIVLLGVRAVQAREGLHCLDSREHLVDEFDGGLGQIAGVLEHGRVLFARDDQLAFALGYWTKLDRAVDFRHDRRFRGFSCFEQLHNARQTAGDVFRLGCLPRNLGDDIPRLDFFAVVDHQVRAHRHLVSLEHLVTSVANFQSRLFLLVRRVLDHHMRQASDLIGFFFKRNAFFQVLELHASGHFGQDREGEWVPRRH